MNIKIDLFFKVNGLSIPVDHGYLIYSAICHLKDMEWLHQTEGIGVHLIRGLYNGEGELALTKHSKLGFRSHTEELPKLVKLAGKKITLKKHSLRLGLPQTYALIPATVLYSHFVTTKNGNDEQRFDTEIQKQLNDLEIKGIPARGRRKTITIRDKKVVGFPLLIEQLSAEESIRLQEKGLGGRRKMGCGVFGVCRREGDDG